MNIFLSVSFNICSGRSSHLIHDWDGSFEYLQYMFRLRIEKIIFLFKKLARGYKTFHAQLIEREIYHAHISIIDTTSSSLKANKSLSF